MRRTFLKILFSLIVLLIGSTSSKVQCQYQPSKWVRGKNFKITDREVLVSTIYGVDVIVDGYDGTVSQNIKNSGQWQANNLRNMAQFVNKGSTILNIGSHIGLQVIALGKQVGQTGRIFIFEPFSVSFNMVLKNVYLNDLGDIATVYNVAGGNKKTKGYISVSNYNTGGSEIFTQPGIRDAPVKTEEVSVDLVDNVLPKDAIIDFALIDVERFQVECLQGMKQTISRSPNLVIMCEWSGISYNTRDIGKKTEELLTWFVQKKYKFYQLDWNRGNCQNSKYVELDLKKVLGIRNLMDVFFIPSHIDPNKPQ